MSSAVSRNDFYELVWKKPLTTIAKQFDVTTSDIKRLCEEQEIPRPPNGYWAQLKWGTEPPKLPLPELDEEAEFEIRSFRKSFEASIKTSAEQSKKIEVPHKLTDPHPFVETVKDRLHKPKKPRDGSWSSSIVWPRIEVSPPVVDRALRILDTIYRHWESLGGVVGEEDGGLGIGCDFVNLGIEEKPDQRLCLAVYGLCVDGLRRTWADAKVQTVESALENFFATLPNWIERVKNRRLDDECVQRQKQKAHLRENAGEILQQAWDQQEKELLFQVENWDRAARVRRYLAALDATLEEGHMQPSNPVGFKEWREWADRYADTICPLTATPKSDFQEEPIENPALDDLDFTRSTREVVSDFDILNADELSRLSKAELRELCGQRSYDVLEELHRVMVGLGYDMSESDWLKHDFLRRQHN